MCTQGNLNVSYSSKMRYFRGMRFFAWYMNHSVLAVLLQFQCVSFTGRIKFWYSKRIAQHLVRRRRNEGKSNINTASTTSQGFSLKIFTNKRVAVLFWKDKPFGNKYIQCYWQRISHILIKSYLTKMYIYMRTFYFESYEKSKSLLVNLCSCSTTRLSCSDICVGELIGTKIAAKCRQQSSYIILTSLYNK